MGSNVRRRIVILTLSLLALFVTSWLDLFLQRKQNIIGAGINRAFLFLLINLHVVIIVVLLYIIIRQSIKLFLERRKELPGSIFKRNLLFVFTFFSVLPSFFRFFLLRVNLSQPALMIGFIFVFTMDLTVPRSFMKHKHKHNAKLFMLSDRV